MTLTKISPGQQITHTQQFGLNLVSQLSHGRDVILAIDLTESVGLNNEARIRLRQIVEDSIKPGITSNIWIQTAADSPLRIADSSDSQERQAGINILPVHKRSLSITTPENKPYTFTIVDAAPTGQEFCTPAPGNQETCLVNPYLRQQLWIPSLILLLILASLLGVAFKLHRLRHKWELHIYVEEHEEQICRLKNNQRIAIGEDDTNCTDFIDCPGTEVRAYLERQGEKLYLVPNESTSIHYNGRKITSRTLISGSQIRLNFPDTHQGDYEISIQLKK
ncbi:hypothetical protein PN465_00305 [Nodularia spumigena CS-584]|uniref:FHA domain-containing protein n=2 Tax=Nodularia spumigena TaxID=70799 RepID=A0A2S0Q7H6_NODSP|nr:hypothetical protein [Nodularia spumigena]AHJ27759.1 hypothetical protein NSP_14240 [Nodularia spumigena CCY9414]AVZ30331.1 hypothetical protein BMF81_01780 [Nodularia spumigena UHCC 0039]EAW44430.1 hypothetical protein N9414_17877 [Nodularia spumigena CCY9414]MDB9380688.1 hypothetical protein [Nodularia spumigena CS-584]MEA5608791.1 hypothetical protein [Nodularia spumigena UHCC 0060]